MIFTLPQGPPYDDTSFIIGMLVLSVLIFLLGGKKRKK